MTAETERARAVKRAERASEHGYKEGGYVHEIDGTWVPASVSVSFYQGTQWWLNVQDRERQKLTPELWAKTKKLRLS